MRRFLLPLAGALLLAPAAVAQTCNGTETFFKNDFSVERWRLAALKNAFSLLGLQRFHHAAAFFLLGNSVRDAIEVREDALKMVRCSRRVHAHFNDIVIMRLYFVLSSL